MVDASEALPEELGARVDEVHARYVLVFLKLLQRKFANVQLSTASPRAARGALSPLAGLPPLTSPPSTRPRPQPRPSLKRPLSMPPRATPLLLALLVMPPSTQSKRKRLSASWLSASPSLPRSGLAPRCFSPRSRAPSRSTRAAPRLPALPSTLALRRQLARIPAATLLLPLVPTRASCCTI